MSVRPLESLAAVKRFTEESIVAEKVLTAQQGRVLLVTLNRPEVRNCVDDETAELLYAAVERFRTDPRPRRAGAHRGGRGGILRRL
ncbi:MAG: hypothetical protein KatS3mg131_2712 [Candidatus Tectimicrobiota bacterium]|nr:MAG: hypothetical protein KatS3mg131_2712 [Candidatus Tectomicrobia bacterium]